MAPRAQSPASGDSAARDPNEEGWAFDHVHVPPEEYRVHSGRMDKKVLTADGVEWQGRFAVMTANELCFSSLKGETKEYWPEDTPCSDEQLRAVFTRADADGTGTLDESEVQGCLAELNMPNSDKTVQALMSQIDADGTGTLDWEEFKILAKQAAWTNIVVDYIPLAELTAVTYEVVNKYDGKKKAFDTAGTKDERETSDALIVVDDDEHKAKKRSFVKKLTTWLESHLNIDIDGDGQSNEHVIIPKIDPEYEEIQLVMGTVEDGHNSGRSYIYRVSPSYAQEWLDILYLHWRQARDRERKKILFDKYGDSNFSYFRALVKMFYESKSFQSFAAVLIAGAFVVDVCEAQLLPEEDTTMANTFFMMDLSISVLFTLELLLNLFSHSEKRFKEFREHYVNYFDVFIVVCQLLSIFIYAVEANFPNAKLLRVLRIVRVLRIFSRFQSLNKLVSALGCAFVPVCNAFVILTIVTAIYAIFGTHYFKDTAPQYFARFKTSMFTMFQVVTGDSWASAISRSMFDEDAAATGEVDTDISVFFVTYIFICGVVLFNVVVAVLLDEFICFIASEKERLAREKEAELEKLRITGCLDPLTKTLIAFDDTEDLHLKIDGIYRRLDNDDSGGLNFEEFRQGLKHMTIKDRHSEGHIALDIHLTRDDFDTVTEHGVFLGSKGEFNKLQFRNMMRGELERYVRRCIANCLRTSDSEEYRSTVMLIKMMEISLDNSFLEIRQEREKDRQLLQQFLGDGRGRGFEGAGETGTSPETLHSKERGNNNATVFQAASKIMAAKSQSGVENEQGTAFAFEMRERMQGMQDQLNAITAQLQSLTPTSNGAQYDHIPIAPPLSQNLRVPPLGSLSSDQNGAGSSAGLASLDGAGKRQTRSRSRSKGMSRSSSVRDANLDASNVSDEVYECKWRCGFTGTFDSVSEHEDTCRFSRQSGKSNGHNGPRHPQSFRSQHPPPRRSSGRSKSPREAARHTTGHSKSPRMSHGTTGSRRLEKFDRFLEKVIPPSGGDVVDNVVILRG